MVVTYSHLEFVPVQKGTFQGLGFRDRTVDADFLKEDITVTLPRGETMKLSNHIHEGKIRVGLN